MSITQAIDAKEILPVAHEVSSQATKPVPSEVIESEVHGFKLWSIMIAIILACFLMLLDVAVLSTAIPYITSDFHSLADISWYGAAYQLATAAIQPLSGKIYASFSTKWTFVMFFAIFELGSLLCALSTSSNFLIVGRAIAGMGVAGIQNGAFTTIAGLKPIHKRPALIGITMGLAQLGLVLGPLIGGALTQYTTWRWCFWINLPCGAVVGLALVFVSIPEVMSKPKAAAALRNLHHNLDLVGFCLFAPSVIMLLLAVQWGGNRYAWNSSVVIGLFIGSGVNGLVWLSWNHHKKDDAMIPVSVLKQRTVWSGCLTYGFLMSTLIVAAYYLPTYFQGVKGATPTLSGVYILPNVLAQLIFAILAGKLVAMVGFYVPFSWFSSVMMAIGYGLASTLSPSTSTGRWIGYQILYGTGSGSGLQMPLIAVQNTVMPAQIPVAMGLTTFASTFSSALFLSFAGTIFTNSLRAALTGAAGLDVDALLASGATSLRNAVPQADLEAVLDGYASSIDRVFYMLAALGAACFFTAFGLGWKNIRQKAEAAEPGKA